MRAGVGERIATVVVQKHIRAGHSRSGREVVARVLRVAPLDQVVSGLSLDLKRVSAAAGDDRDHVLAGGILDSASDGGIANRYRGMVEVNRRDVANPGVLRKCEPDRVPSVILVFGTGEHRIEAN